MFWLAVHSLHTIKQSQVMHIGNYHVYSQEIVLEMLANRRISGHALSVWLITGG